MHHENQILVCTYQETIFSLHQETEKYTEVPITAYQSKEADQQLIRHTLHSLFPCFSYEKIADTGVMILLIAYLSDIL